MPSVRSPTSRLSRCDSSNAVGVRPRVGECPLVHLERKLAVDLERRDLAHRLHHPRVGRAIALLVDTLLERRATDEVFDDGATQLAAHVFRKLRAVDRLILILALLQLAIEIRERHILAVDPRSESRDARQAEIDAPEDEAEGDETEDDDHDPFAERVVNALQHGRRPKKTRTDSTPGAR